MHFHNVDVNCKYHLFKNLCTSFYGSQLLDFSCRGVNQVYVAWRKTLRKLLKLSNRTHSSLLPYIVDDFSIDVQLHCRFLKFFHGLINSSNVCTKVLALHALHGSQSSVCNSLNFVCTLYDVSKFSLSNCAPGSFLKRIADLRNNVYLEQTASVVGELLDSPPEGFTLYECRVIIDFLCTN